MLGYDFFLPRPRCRFRGEMKVAEVTSRFTDVNAFLKALSGLGLQLEHKVGAAYHL